MKRYSDCPTILRDFLTYHETIKGQSSLTISEYYLDIRMFFRFIKLMRFEMPINTPLDSIPINDIDLKLDNQIDYYNENISIYNTLLKKFPSNIVASLSKYKEKLFFDRKDMSDEDYNDFKL